MLSFVHFVFVAKLADVGHIGEEPEQRCLGKRRAAPERSLFRFP